MASHPGKVKDLPDLVYNPLNFDDELALREKDRQDDEAARLKARSWGQFICGA